MAKTSTTPVKAQPVSKRGANGTETNPRNWKKKKATPEPGDPKYKSPTQLRNARKRQQKKREKEGTGKRNGGSLKDPSLEYIYDPKSAPVVKAATRFFAERGHDFPVTVSPKSDWRTVSKLAVRRDRSNGCLSIGLFVPGSHDLCPIPRSGCQAHHPHINDAVKVIQKVCRKLDVSAFDESEGSGNLRYVAVNIERSTGNQQVSLVWKSDSSGSTGTLDKLCEELILISNNIHDQRLALQSLWVHYNEEWKHSNAIFSRNGRWDRKNGDEKEHGIVEYLGKGNGGKLPCIPLYFPPFVFRQANIDAFTKIVENIRTWLQSTKQTSRIQCLELYGGVGTIGLHLADLFESLVSSDENPHNQACFERSAQSVPLPDATYRPLNATDMVKAGAMATADVVILDPPRKGLDDAVVRALCEEKRPKYLVYVSCGFEAFQRDFQELMPSWELHRAEGHVLFPGSDAIETLAFFTRKEGKASL